MFSESTLAVATKVGLVAATLLVAAPGAIWLAIKYIQFLTWAGNL